MINKQRLLALIAATGLIWPLNAQSVFAQVLAIQPGINAPTPMGGNQANFAGPIGMDFVVNAPIQVTSLAVFDAAQNGINANGDLTVELWSRNTNGTSSVADDTGQSIVLSDIFSNASPGVLNGKFRTKALASPFTLQPGAYTISAYGFSAFNNFWNYGEPHDASIGPPLPNESGGAIQFVGTGRYGSGGSGYPGSPDGGPATRYLAGNFAYNPPAFDTLLSVRVNRTTGALTLANGTASPVNILGYSITSAFGSVNSDNWKSIAANYDGNNDGSVDSDDNWTRLTAAGARTDLSEFEFDAGNGATLSSLQSVNLGTGAWIGSHIEDLVFKYVLANGTTVNGTVQYTGGPGNLAFKRGDLDFNGTSFQLADFTNVMRPNLISSHTTLSQAEAYRLGDLNGDLMIDQKDFRLFKDAYLAGGGTASDLAAALGAPEPTSVAICSLAMFIGLGFARCRTSRRATVALLMFVACVVVGSNRANAQTVALQSTVPLIGNQSFGGELGMDFNVRDLPISVSSLGFFDSGQNGLSSGTVTVELWSRNNGGTPTDPADDTGGSILATASFTPGSDGALVGGMRFKSITSLQLNPGSYSIVAGGFSVADPLANSGELPPVPAPTVNDLGGVIQFVGSGRFGTNFAPGAFPPSPDGGPANRYNAGTFRYSAAFTPLVLEVNRQSGEMVIKNEGSSSFNTDFYELRSSSGSLNPVSWASLQDQALSGWLENGTTTGNLLTESNLTSSTVFGPSATRTLGNAYLSGVDGQDISFNYTTTGGVTVAAQVRYINAPVGVPGDYNNNGKVDAADYLVWRKRLGQTFALPNEVAGVTTGTVTQEDYTAWRARFSNVSGSGSGSGAAPSAVPEPSMGIIGLLTAFAAILGTRVTRRQLRLVASMGFLTAGVLVGQSVHANVFLERDYQFGDDPLENAVANQIVGSANSGITRDLSGPTGARVHLLVDGDPTYVSVADRPGASGGALGAKFDGVGDRLQTNISMNAPTNMWDSADFFPSQNYPLNYELLLSHGMQMWVKPDAAGQNTRQDIILDTAQHGIFISANNKWSQRFQQFGSFPTEVVSNANVQFGQWTHVMHISGISDLSGGLSAANSALLVNGVAVSAISNVYNGGDATNLSIGSNQAGDGNFFRGTLDDAQMFLWGNNTGQSKAGGAPFGQNYGQLFLGTDNAWIARQLSLSGVTNIADVNLDGAVNSADVTAFVPNWLFRQTLSGVQVGDWISRQKGDLNYDGVIDLSDALILHQNLLSATGSGLDFSLLRSSTPEPSSALLVISGLAVGGLIRNRRK